MRQYFSFLAILILSTTAFVSQAQIVNIPDANFKAYFISIGLDLNNDSEIQVSEAQLIMGDIDVENLNISDLTGIEAFINCNELKCGGNQLTTIDLSQNVGLEELFCENNQLTSLTLPSAGPLWIIDCSNNQLTTLDASNNSALEELYANDNQLSSINLNNCVTLFEANLRTNQLDSLDVSPCDSMHTLDCSFNTPLKALDFSGNDSLKNIDCSNGDLRSLDMRTPNYTDIVTFNALGNSNLYCIEVLDTAYANTNWLDIGPSANFSLINCSSIVNIPDVNFKAYLTSTSAINKNGDTEIQLSEALGFNGLIDIFNLGVADLTGVEAFKNLNRLHAGINNLTTLDVSQNTKLRELQCFQNQLTALNVSNNPQLGLLWCSRNQLTALDVSNNPNLDNFLCSFNQLTSIDVSSNPLLARFYTGFNQLTSLDVSSNPNLVDFNCRNATLTSLNLKNGNNTNFMLMDSCMMDNPNLTCVEVDDSTYSTNNWGNYIDAGVSFSNNCFFLNVPNLEKEQFTIDIYPNPTNGFLSINLETIQSAIVVNVLNALGQEMQSITYTNRQIIDLNLNALPGWYFIQVETSKGSQTIKVLKQ